MFTCIIDRFNSLELIDKILLIVLVVSLVAKLIGDIASWIICRRLNTDKTYACKCIHLDSQQHDNCSIPVFKKKYFKEQHCNKKACPGYSVSSYSIDQIKQLYKFPFWILTILKSVSELSTIILIVRTLLLNVSKS